MLHISAVSTQGMTELHFICEELLNHCVKSKDNSTVILVQFKPVAGIPPHPPASAVTGVQSSATGTSSSSNPRAGAEAKDDTSSEIKEVE